MSRAFVNEDAASAGMLDLPDRPISRHRNLVTRRGLALIEAALDRHRAAFDKAKAESERDALARHARELRYWSARRANAQLIEPDPSARGVSFGVAVEIGYADGAVARLRLVGEDEADPAQGRIAWTAPVARSLLGAEVGDSRRLPRGEVEILSLDATPEPTPPT